jgi:hypothetical protein
MLVARYLAITLPSEKQEELRADCAVRGLTCNQVRILSCDGRPPCRTAWTR